MGLTGGDKMTTKRKYTSKGYAISDTALAGVALTRKEEADKALARVIVSRLFRFEYRKLELGISGL